jgi:tetratricopeptide (TPR) repeat protein
MVLGQLQFQAGQYKAATDTMNGLIAASEKAGQVPKEAYLQIVYAAAYKQSDNPSKPDKATVAVLEKLVRYYPKPTYWEGLMAAMASQQTSDPVRFQLDRLMMAVGVLKNGTDYFEMAQLANNFGFPGEAQAVLDMGYNAKLLGVGPGKERDDRLMAQIKKLAETDRASLPALDKKARAAATGQEDALLGEAYYGYGQYPQAIEALERGLGKGGVKKPDQAQIALGISYLRNKQNDQAKAAFKKVPADSELGRIAGLWILHASAGNSAN